MSPESVFLILSHSTVRHHQTLKQPIFLTIYNEWATVTQFEYQRLVSDALAFISSGLVCVDFKQVHPTLQEMHRDFTQLPLCVCV